MQLPDDLNRTLDELLVRLNGEHSLTQHLTNDLGIRMRSLKLRYPAKDQYGQKKRELAASLRSELEKHNWVSDILRQDIRRFLDDLEKRMKDTSGKVIDNF
jgi:hypothetical protein